MEAGPQDLPHGYVSVDKYNALVSKYEALKTQFREYKLDAEARATKAAAKIRMSKEAVRKWQLYLDKQFAKKALRQAEQEALHETGQDVLHLAEQEATHGAEPEALHEVEQDFATPRARAEVTGPSRYQLSIPHPALEAARAVSAPLAYSPAPSKITSSQTTEGEAVSSSSHAGRSDDSPVVVSVKTLKRKHESPTRSSHRVRIKHETLSSSPLMQPVFFPPLLRTETSDLDVVQGHPERTLERAQNLLETPISGRASKNRPTSNHAGLSQPRLNNSFTRDHPPHSENTVQTVKPEPGLQNESEINENEPQTARKSVESRDSRPAGAPLRNMSPNTPTLPRTSASSFTSNRKLDHSRGAANLHVLSEDGDNISLGFKKRRTSTHQQQPTPKSVGPSRLNQLLTGSSPQIDRTILSPRTAIKTCPSREPPTQTPQSERPVRTIQKAPEAPQSRHTPKTRPATTASDNFDVNQDPGPINPDHEPLRSRPLHRLDIDDFKINPNYNSNLGYAFRETVRKRAERACLPGCTREECCGAIRRFIAAGGLPADTSLTDDELTLQGYLGSAYAKTIKSATGREKQNMLVEARAKAFADNHGKHRQAFERRTTPPGFWRTDMPTTQEAEEDREESRKMTRQKVEERWRDAMRGGERYMFRDE